jgi:hypothetical protein
MAMKAEVDFDLTMLLNMIEYRNIVKEKIAEVDRNLFDLVKNDMNSYEEIADLLSKTDTLIMFLDFLISEIEREFRKSGIVFRVGGEPVGFKSFKDLIFRGSIGGNPEKKRV